MYNCTRPYTLQNGPTCKKEQDNAHMDKEEKRRKKKLIHAAMKVCK